MDRADVAILVNSTPPYYYILPFFFGMLRRYGRGLHWKVLLGSEQPDHPVCREVAEKYDVEIVPIPSAYSSFIDSRWYCLSYLQGRFAYVLPLQDDFILERPLWGSALDTILEAMDVGHELVSVRLMPCPGPVSGDKIYLQDGQMTLRTLSPTNDLYGFTYQATIWRWDACLAWFQTLADRLQVVAPREFTEQKARVRLEVGSNIAENAEGQKMFWDLAAARCWTHVAWERLGPWPNAVYLSPFPYRPTAIVRGALEGWAKELAKREGFAL